MPFRRLALYHLPDGPLGAFGAAWLGWDARRGATLPRPELPHLPDEAETLTAVPMRYGFHATLKAPFRLAPGHEVQDVARRARLVCDHLTPFDLQLELARDYGFVALRPRQQPPQLQALEQALVTRLDDLRAPLSPEERDRRRPDLLPEPARRHLDHWGYPHVLELFQYHLTLSGQLAAEDAKALCQALQAPLAPLLAQPMAVKAVALVGEDAEGRFHQIEEIPLLGQIAD
ncbi:DUF1045 domain-containing protein [Paracoccus limosus]|uniref:DUF1045 domain-containing protein n=1 Tax=Paracoccus limosus TaxID=913252 RepID=A0A844H4C1_9RHOB|nr:DUF1045 domain-containing protein [Paracoccus limosus]MTH35652.1 DUF1045 domain-containing protein [Paracoccus limosus]